MTPEERECYIAWYRAAQAYRWGWPDDWRYVYEASHWIERRIVADAKAKLIH